MLYIDVATIAMIAGTEYCTRSFDTEAVPNVISFAASGRAMDVSEVCDELFSFKVLNNSCFVKSRQASNLFFLYL